MKIEAIVDCKTVLGEGPLWDVQQSKLYWIDSYGPRIFRANADGTQVERWDLPAHQKIGSMALRQKGGAILSLSDGFYTFDFESGACTLLHQVPHKSPNLRVNDGKVDQRGRFVAGSMDVTEQSADGVLYSVDADGRVRELDHGIVVSNGPCWSPDGATFYFADSRSKTIWAYDYDQENGQVRNKRAFVRFDDHDGLPDGATVDAEGCVWSAGVYQSKIHRFSPRGERLLTIKMPVVCVTSVMFGGAKLDTLYATCMLRAPVPGVTETGALAGSLFAITGLGVQGLAEHRFAG